MEVEKPLNGDHSLLNGVPEKVNGHHHEDSLSPVGSPRTAPVGSPGSESLMKKPLPILDERLKKRVRKLSRSNSKDGVLGVAGTPNFVAPHRKWKNSRRPHNGYGRGLPKKGGAGGKGVWGKPGSEIYQEVDEEDQNDPNFDLDAYNSLHNIELKEVVPEMTDEEFQKKVEPIFLEYYEHGDTHEVAQSLDEFITPERRPLISKIAVEMAFEHKQSQREMTSVLLSDLYGRIVTNKDICSGFDMLLFNMPDLILDTPEAPHILGNFVARAVADDCVPPKYAYDIEREGLCPQAREALIRACSLLSLHQGWGHLDDVWGVGGALRPVQTLTRQMAILLKEYLLSRDLEEAQRSIKELEVVHFHHELVYEAIVMTLEALNEQTEEAICALLKSLDDTCIITPEQMEQGFRRVYDDMTDIVLDIPLAYSILDRFVQRCHADGDMSGAESDHSASSRAPDHDSSAEEADEPDSDDSSEMSESECERRRSDCLDNLTNLEKQFIILKEQLYKEKMSQVDQQLLEIRGGRSQEYLAPLQRLVDNMNSRKEVAEILKNFRIENIRNKFESELQASRQHFESEKQLAMDAIYEELMEKIRRLEEDRHNVDISWADWGTSTRTSKVRGPGRKKAVTVSGPYIVYMLREEDILEDWTSIRKALKRSTAAAT